MASSASGQTGGSVAPRLGPGLAALSAYAQGATPRLDEVARRDSAQDVLRMPAAPPSLGCVGDVTIETEEEEDDEEPQAPAPPGAARLPANMLAPQPVGASRPPVRFDASTKADGWIRRHSALSPPSIAA
ncbi:MAG TPA: hypothetical protein VFH51_13065 [Myxococcota bacterium]|nr:hypothetical protein [Myxococcota bacterium]